MDRTKPARTDEVLRGLTTFAAMSYIIVLNPIILAPLGIPLGWIVIATCLIAALGSIWIGVAADAPAAMAPGMGLNNFMASFGIVWSVGAPVLLAINFLAGSFVRHLSRLKWTEFQGERECMSTRLKWLRSLPRSLQNIIDASIAGLLLFVASTFVAQDQAIRLGSDPSEPVVAIISRMTLLDGEGRITPLFAVALTTAAIFLFRVLTDQLLHALDGPTAAGARESSSARPGWRLRAAGGVRILQSLTLLGSVALAWTLIGPSSYAVAADGPGSVALLDPEWWLSGFRDTAPDTLIYTIIYFFTVLFVLIFDVTGTPYVMLPPDAERRDERIGAGFKVDSTINMIAPCLAVSPISCYVENKVVEEVGRSRVGGGSAIIAGLLFLLVGLGAAVELDGVIALMSSIPRSAIAPMLLWVMINIAASEVTGARRPDPGETADDAAPGGSLQRYEGMIAAGVTLLGAVPFGLAFGLSLGIVLIFVLGLLAGREKAQEEYVLFLFASVALVGQGATMLKAAVP